MRVSVPTAHSLIFWPPPYPMTSVVHLATAKSILEVPVLPPAATREVSLPVPEARQERPEVKAIEGPGVPSQVVTYDPLRGINSVEWKFGYAWTIGSTRYDNSEREYYE